MSSSPELFLLGLLREPLQQLPAAARRCQPTRFQDNSPSIPNVLTGSFGNTVSSTLSTAPGRNRLRLQGEEGPPTRGTSVPPRNGGALRSHAASRRTRLGDDRLTREQCTSRCRAGCRRGRATDGRRGWGQVDATEFGKSGKWLVTRELLILFFIRPFPLALN